MAITATKPLEVEEVPTTPSKTLTDLWLTRIVLDMPSTTKGIAQITAHHFDPQTGAVSPSEAENLNVKDLAKAIQEVPEVAEALVAILQAFPALREWQALEDAPVIEPTEDPGNGVNEPAE
jgi:hypothetical protein